MCGITGYLNRPGAICSEQQIAIVRRMASTLRHRGPDDSGEFADPESGVALGHTRLSIIDPSSHGHQPMVSTDGRFTMVYNGEIYNYRRLRDDLQASGQTFSGHCDTEVLLAAFSQWGLIDALERAAGMFALAVWDRDERQLALARDRLGIKPLYYGWQDSSFLFGSELKSIRAHPDFRAEICRDALALYLRYNYVPCPHSIYQRIFKLPPGCLLYIKPDSPTEEKLVTYWDAREVVRQAVENPFDGSQQEAVDQLETVLSEAVRCRMYADVDLGASLSGGIDSSAVVALMQANSARPVRTFSIGFAEADYNEAVEAKAVADHLGTNHTEWYVSPAEARDVIPRLPEIFDEPFGDSSQIPTHLVSQLARRQVTVSLSGDGGDELFGGYERYSTTLRRWRRISSIPAPLRLNLSRALGRLRPTTRLGKKATSLAGQLAVKTPADVYAYTIAHWPASHDLVIGANSVATIHSEFKQWQVSQALLEQMMFVDQVTYLPDDILVKVDRASMATSLEARVPMLDHRVVEFAWSIPPEMKRRDNQSKWLLRQVLARYVPRSLIDRPKRGFGIPIDSWLRGPLRDWAEALLDTQRLTREGFLQPDPIRQKWDAHLSGKVDWHYHLWDVLMFQAWLEAEQGKPAARG